MSEDLRTDHVKLESFNQWRRYTRARHVKWPAWLEDPPPWLRPAYCFASVIVWTANKNVTISRISDRFLSFLFWHWQWNNQRKHCPLAAYGPTTCGVSLFSQLIKTHLRTTMLDDRLSDIAMLSVHSQRADALDLDLVDNFANKYPNCRIMLW